MLAPGAVDPAGRHLRRQLLARVADLHLRVVEQDGARLRHRGGLDVGALALVAVDGQTGHDRGREQQQGGDAQHPRDHVLGAVGTAPGKAAGHVEQGAGIRARHDSACRPHPHGPRVLRRDSYRARIRAAASALSR
ncbi:hypothetical protein GCM10009559_24900 [Pseudonocardia zijingensis]|uniref:Uncharacterized protein n=1 Tax=Pseudonocardia zijingensis TaxID=153376 RepID=A0ABP4ABW6_9PSEU